MLVAVRERYASQPLTRHALSPVSGYKCQGFGRQRQQPISPGRSPQPPECHRWHGSSSPRYLDRPAPRLLPWLGFGVGTAPVARYHHSSAVYSCRSPVGYFDQFPPTSLSVGCRFGQRTFAGATRNGKDAPKAAICTRWIELGGSILSGRSWPRAHPVISGLASPRAPERTRCRCRAGPGSCDLSAKNRASVA